MRKKTKKYFNLWVWTGVAAVSSAAIAVPLSSYYANSRVFLNESNYEDKIPDYNNVQQILLDNHSQLKARLQNKRVQISGDSNSVNLNQLSNSDIEISKQKQLQIVDYCKVNNFSYSQAKDYLLKLSPDFRVKYQEMNNNPKNYANALSSTSVTQSLFAILQSSSSGSTKYTSTLDDFVYNATQVANIGSDISIAAGIAAVAFYITALFTGPITGVIASTCTWIAAASGAVSLGAKLALNVHEKNQWNIDATLANSLEFGRLIGDVLEKPAEKLILTIMQEMIADIETAAEVFVAASSAISVIFPAVLALIGVATLFID